MSADTGDDGRKPRRTPGRSQRLTPAALADRLAERPWALAFASFVATALLIRPSDLGLL